jgi:hypothetical protein
MYRGCKGQGREGPLPHGCRENLGRDLEPGPNVRGYEGAAEQPAMLRIVMPLEPTSPGT